MRKQIELDGKACRSSSLQIQNLIEKYIAAAVRGVLSDGEHEEVQLKRVEHGKEAYSLADQ